MKNIMIYGAGGFGREIACLINSINEAEPRWKFLGFIDDGIAPGTINSFGQILGNIEFLNSYPDKVAVIVSIANSAIIKKIVSEITNPQVWYPSLIAPDVRFHDHKSFTIGIGNILFSSCRISCNVSIGNFNLLNSMASLGHDVVLGDRNILNPGVRISGNSKIGNDNYFGINAVILPEITIGDNTRIGVSSVIIRNTIDRSLYFGNPAKKVKL